MGFIREPKGFDFIIQSGTLTDEDRKEISRFIAAYKLKNIKRIQPEIQKRKNKELI
jgi:hypothetical protein